MRAFIGIELSREIKDNIIKIQETIRNESINGRWKYVDNFHVTLKFLGEVSEGQINSIYDCMIGKIQSRPKFTLTAGEVGYFMGSGCLRVIYLNIEDPDKRLEDLFRMTEDCCIGSGLAKENRRFTPHITIAQDVVLKCTFEDIRERMKNFPQIVVPVREVSIIKSQQIDNKRVYTPVKTLALMESQL